MCGRLVLAETASDLAAMFDIEQEADDLPPESWNVAPTAQIPIVVESAKTGEVVRRLESARWSLVPSFASEVSGTFSTFNARSETVAEKPTFASSVARHRALVPVTGYYEWHTENGVKTPYFICADDGLPLALAALYSWWRNPAVAPTDPARWLLSATILTTDAQGPLAAIHDRVPVVLPEECWDEWLDPHTVGDQALVDAVVAASRELSNELSFHVVGTVRGDGPELIEPAPE
jgi:putative SOS response-associated peptidase YedK